MPLRAGRRGEGGGVRQGVTSSTESEHPRMGLRLALHSSARTTGGGTFGGRLPRVMPATQSLEILQRVIVAGLDMIRLISGRAAEDAERVAGLALVAVTPKDADTARAPVSGKASLAVA